MKKGQSVESTLKDCCIQFLLHHSFFKCRLPSLTELDKIRDVIHNQEKRFFGYNLSTDIIDIQKAEYARMACFQYMLM